MPPPKKFYKNSEGNASSLFLEPSACCSTRTSLRALSRAGNQFGDYREATARFPLRVDLTPPEPGFVYGGLWDEYQYVNEAKWFPDGPAYWNQVAGCVNDLYARAQDYAHCVCHLNHKIQERNCKLNFPAPLCPAQKLNCPGPDPGPMCRLCHWNPQYRHRTVWGKVCPWFWRRVWGRTRCGGDGMTTAPDTHTGKSFCVYNDRTSER